MKKILALFLTLCLVTTLTTPYASAAGTDQTSVQQMVQALGIISGDQNGSLNLSANVTRAQFAKMMIAASTFKDTISAKSSSSPFRDVKYSYWAASYIQTAAAQGWLTGYSGGDFRPDNNVKLEEAVSAVLKMLGYTPSSFSGSFPESYIAKYTALGLSDNISAVQGQFLTRQDCMYLFYNLMSTQNSSQKYYATTLGYAVNSSGEIDYSSLVLSKMKGPYIVSDSTWSSYLPFTAGSATVYLDGNASNINAVSAYDVYYYNASMHTVWVYDNRVTGIYSAASPSTAAPTQVTVAGNNYTLSTSSVAYAMSNIGSFRVGDTVTLLLGKNGDAVGVVSSALISSTKYGIITATGSQSYTDASGTTHKYSTVTLVSTDGSSYTYQLNSASSSTVGELVQATVSSGVTTISILQNRSLSGVINSAGTALGTYGIASNIQILDTTEKGSYVKVYPIRLAGLSLGTNDIRYFALDSSGNISQLILNNVTDDMYSYGIVTSAKGGGDMDSSASYTYILDGTTVSMESAITFSASTGPASFEINNGNIVAMNSLSPVTLSSVSASTANSGNVQYPIANKTAVYIYSGNIYTLSNISSVSGSGYTLTGYLDKAVSSGGQIRIIIASKN